MRSDAVLIKHLSKTYNPRLGFFWQQLPYVEFSRRACNRMLEDEQVLRSRASEIALSWDHAVFHLPIMEDASGSVMPVWARVIPWADQLCTYQKYCPWLIQGLDTANEITAKADRAQEQLVVHIDLWLMVDGRFVADIPEMADLSLRDVDAGFQIASRLYDQTKKAGAPAGFLEKLENDINNLFLWVRDALYYVGRCPEYLVEEKPEVPVGTPPHTAKSPKPWTYNHLPRVILLDPAQAPSGETKSQSGSTHASPRPHQRRGHWATLKHPKFQRNEDGSLRQVFVKPAWVGPREWIMRGNRYRVIEQEIGDGRR